MPRGGIKKMLAIPKATIQTPRIAKNPGVLGNDSVLAQRGQVGEKLSDNSDHLLIKYWCRQVFFIHIITME